MPFNQKHRTNGHQEKHKAVCSSYDIYITWEFYSDTTEPKIQIKNFMRQNYSIV